MSSCFALNGLPSFAQVFCDAPFELPNAGVAELGEGGGIFEVLAWIQRCLIKHTSFSCFVQRIRSVDAFFATLGLMEYWMVSHQVWCCVLSKTWIMKHAYFFWLARATSSFRSCFVAVLDGMDHVHMSLESPSLGAWHCSHSTTCGVPRSCISNICLCTCFAMHQASCITSLKHCHDSSSETWVN